VRRQSLSIPWQKPPSRKSRQILMPLGVSRSEVRPTRIERRARLVNAIARGRRWLDEIVSGSVINIEQIATRQKCHGANDLRPRLSTRPADQHLGLNVHQARRHEEDALAQQASLA